MPIYTKRIYEETNQQKTNYNAKELFSSNLNSDC